MGRSFDWLIVGLGNPTEVYLETRHNIGWMVVTNLCNKHNVQFAPISKYYYLGKFHFVGSKVIAILPRTFMNNSGFAIALCAESYRIPNERILVVCDEYNFPLGRIHLKDNGGNGGHNGVASAIEHLGSKNFLRLRCGIGNNFGKGELTDYVLSRFEPEEIPLRDLMIKRAVEGIEYLIKNGKSRAMSDINSEKLWKIDLKSS